MPDRATSRGRPDHHKLSQQPPVISPVLDKTNLPGVWVNAWKIDARDKLKSWRAIGVFRAAMDVETVYPVLVDAL